ncbi:MAG: phosphoribosyl-AMP cyclohydrolase [Leptospiraceae bacterium]|nr:phosphoribosyl-AMP cyclohydrolase [Leptospiraceae bacterium]MCB1199669.1 phosphoribosyl-AMP cyclohydrolase [Leptospiraceae bacterium]
MNHKELEEGNQLALDFDKISKIVHNGVNVVPVVVQDQKTKDVLILAYTNLEALQYTLQNNIVAFWSTSRNELWKKGETSGNRLKLIEVRVNCEQNSLLYLVELEGTGSCHTLDSRGKFRHSCYYRKIEKERLEKIAGVE